jgi:hypothetical protein
MNDSENRRHQMFTRTREFFTSHAADFPPASLGNQLSVSLGAIITELDEHAANEASSGSASRQGTVTRAQARAALREDLEAINRTARTMEDQPGLNEKFRLPRGSNDQQLLTAARAFAADALPLKTQFIAHELPADFIEDLNADIDAMEEAINDQSGGLGNRVAATAAIDDAIERGTVIARKLDAIVKNKYANNPATLAEWTSASHTERAPKRKAGPTPPAAGVPPPSTPPST